MKFHRVAYAISSSKLLEETLMVCKGQPKIPKVMPVFSDRSIAKHEAGDRDRSAEVDWE